MRSGCYLQSLVGAQVLEEADAGGYRLGRRVLEPGGGSPYMRMFRGSPR